MHNVGLQKENLSARYNWLLQCFSNWITTQCGVVHKPCAEPQHMFSAFLVAPTGPFLVTLGPIPVHWSAKAPWK